MGTAQYSRGRANVSLSASAPDTYRSQQSRIADIPAAEWDALFDPDYPFTRHAFLKALEDNGCTSPETGWQPCHLVLRDRTGKLSAAAPLYLKAHSYGEFVFDWSWAQASQRLGADYYPKLLCAIPFTPSSGPRLSARDAHSKRALAEQLAHLWASMEVSSLHALFVDATDADALKQQGLLERFDVQFHWHNSRYANFDEFLMRMNAQKRKKILRERRRIEEAGLRFEVRPGHTLTEAQWAEVYELYSNTYEERGQAPYLTLDFFLDYGRQPATPLRLILAYDGSALAAVALTVQGGKTLYGRHWGAAARYHSLHFETCYYQGIEFCIREGLSRYDAGTQGGHKLARGFEPVLTRSMHQILEPRLAQAVAHFLQRETVLVQEHHQNLIQHRPYRKSPEG